MDKKVKSFFSNLSKSLIPQPQYYHRLLRVPLSNSLKYFALLVFFLNLIVFFLFIARLDFDKILTYKTALKEKLYNFPNDLTIYIKDGTVITTYDRPYFLWLDISGERVLFGVVDHEANPDKIEQYSSYFLLGANALAINKNHSPIGNKAISLGALDMTVEKNVASDFADTLNYAWGFIVFLFFIIGVFIVPIIGLIANILILGAGAIVGYVLFRPFNKRHTLQKTFQINLHSSSLPLITLQLLAVFNPYMTSFIIPFFLLSLIFLLCALYEAYLDEPAHRHNHRPLRKHK